MTRIVDGYFSLLKLFIALCLAVMVVLVFGNVVLRYAFNSGITVSEELSRWLFVWMTFLGALVALRTHHHLGTDMLVARLPLAGRKACFLVAHALMLYLCWLMFRGSWQQTVINWETTSAVMEASMGLFYAAGLFFSVVAFVFILNDFLRLVFGRLTESELIGVTESDDMPHGDPHPVPTK